jgi:hypothetical protein
MPDWGTVKSTVQDVLIRPDLSTTTTIELYAQDALRQITDMRDWWWSQDIETSISTADARITLPNNFVAPHSIAVIVDTYKIPLAYIPVEELRSYYETTTTGQPVHYSISGNEIYVGPKPDQAYTYEMVMQQFAAPAADIETNYVTTNLFMPLVHKTCAAICAGVLHDKQQAMAYDALFEQSIISAEDADDRRSRDSGSGDIRPDVYYHEAAFGITNYME